LLGEMMAKTSKPQTYNDVINALTAQSIIIPAELLEKIDAVINENKQLGYATREEFVEAAIVGMLQNLSGKRKKENASKGRTKS
jgi:metal-responsive CopG/Arc/MetJ family transcriptional regulator